MNYFIIKIILILFGQSNSSNTDYPQCFAEYMCIYARTLAVINPHKAKYGHQIYANMIFKIKFIQKLQHFAHTNG